MEDDSVRCRTTNARDEQAGGTRHLAVLSALAEAGTALTLNEIALAVGVPRPSVHRLLGALVQQRWLTVHGSPRRYAPSWKVVELGFQVARRNRVREVLTQAAMNLAASVRSRSYVAFYEDGDVVFTDCVDVRGEQLMPLLMGLRLPAAINVCGRALLTFQSAEEIERALCRELPQMTERTITSKQEIMNRLTIVRQRGYDVMDRENTPGVSGVAVPVFDSSREAIAALGVLIPGQLREEAVDRLLDPTLRVAQQASADLGGQL
jgi:DNA-binding IclR family transcriptional regulator